MGRRSVGGPCAPVGACALTLLLASSNVAANESGVRVRRDSSTSVVPTTTVSGELDDEGSKDAFFLFVETPGWILGLWLGGLFCATWTMYVSYYHTREHIAVSKECGYGGNPFVNFSFGPRADRMLHLLLMPPLLSVSAVLQMILPGAEPLCSLVRTVQVSLAVLKLSELMFILAGGWSRVQANLPKEPIPVYGQPPLCCFYCPRVVTEQDIHWMALGLRQFSILAPLVGSVDAYVTVSRPTGFDKSMKVIVVVFSLVTTIGMWSFNNLYALFKHAVPSRVESLKQRQLYVTLQMISVKLIDMILAQVLPQGYSNGDFWEMSQLEFAAILSGFFVCLVQLQLAFMGRRAYPANRRMYPLPDFKSFPLDLLATLQLSGVRQGTYDLLRELEESSAAELERRGSITLGCESDDEGESSSSSA